MAFGQSERKIWGRRKVPKIGGRSRITELFELRRKDHRCHYNDWLFKFKKVIYLIGYNSYIDIQFLDFTAVFSR